MKKFLLTLMFLVLFAPFALHADEIVVGNGTSTIEGAKTEDGAVFFYDFNDGTFNGMTAIDKDGDGELINNDLTVPYFQHENLVDGQEYTTTVIPVYTDGAGYPKNYIWTNANCDDYVGAYDLKAEFVDNVGVVSWTLPAVYKDDKSSKEGNWLYYDNGTYAERIGLTYDGVNFESFKWAIMFPASDIAQYAGQTMTKVALYDVEDFDGEVEIYEGGTTEPGTLLHSQEFSCIGTQDFFEITLNTAVELSGDKNVWVVFTNINGAQPAAGCADQGNANGRWIYYEGYGWLDLMYISVPSYTWMIRAFVEGEGQEPVDPEQPEETANHWTPDETVYPNNMTLTGLVEIDGEVQNTTSLEVGAFCGEELRGSYRLQYISALDKYLAFLVVYGNDSDEITFKLYDHELGQELDCQMLPESAVIFEVNKVEGDADFPFVIAFQEIEYATSFFFDFNDGTLDGWTLIDADGDGHNWKNISEFAYEPFGYNNTYCAASFSYDNEDGVLWPNNYLVTESKYNIVADSKLTYKVSSHDRIYCAEHYEVAISTTGTNPNDFVTIYEETLSAGEADYEGSLQGQWFDREIDLSVFAGQKVYIAFRHCLCVNQYFMKLDNITLTSDSTPEDPETPEYAKTFFDDFNDGELDGWRTIDQDGDGYNWYIANDAGIDGSACIQSDSYIIGASLYPDNIVVTTSAYGIAAGSTLTWEVKPTDASYCNDHYAVVVSTDNETFTNVWEETLTSFSNFEQRILYLSEYAGQNVYIGFRHYNCNGSNATAVLIDNVELSAIAFSISASVNPEEAGTVNGTGSYQYGETATLTATANDGYQFVSWTESDTIVSTDAEYSFTVESSREFVANFEELPEYASFFFDDFNDHNFDGWRTIDQDGDGHTWRIPNRKSYILSESYDDSNNEELNPDNYIVTTELYKITEKSVLGWLVMPSDDEYYEDHYAVVISTDNETFDVIWEETLTSFNDFEQRVLNLNEYAGQNIYIGFRHYNCNGSTAAGVLIDDVELSAIYNVTANVNPEEAGTVNGAGSYQYGGTATLTATANVGWQFVNWTENDEVVSEDAEYSFIVETARELVANFELQTFNVTAIVYPGVAGIVSGTGSYHYGETATLTATANDGFQFVNWTENGEVVSEDAEYSFTVEAYRELVANFEQTSFETAFFEDFNDGALDGWRLFQNDSDTHNWQIVGSNGVDGSNCITSYSYKFEVLNPDNYIVTELKYAITENSMLSFASRPAVSGFYQDQYAVVVSEDNENWTVVWSEKFNEYYSEFRYKYVDLSEYAGQKVYIGLRHYDCNGSDANNVLVDDVELVEAVSIKANVNPEEAGTVSGNGNYIAGQTATLTAVANVGWQFVNWTENDTIVSESAEYSFTVEADRELVANFEEVGALEITAVANPEEAGTVNGAGSYQYGGTATLTATANTGYQFVNWTENDEVVSEDAEYSFVVESARELVANFEVAAFNVTATVYPGVAGIVSGIGEYRYGETATLTATANDGFQFVNWTENGEVVSEDAEYSFTVEAYRELVANFEQTVFETAFFDDFNDGVIDGWRTIDQDGDSYNWEINSNNGVDNTSCITSYSYKFGVHNPDNYIVTEPKYAITENSMLSFASRPAVSGYYQDQYAVVVSEDNENWTIVWSEKFNEYYTEFRYKYVDLSEYAGKNVYIGFRHYDTNGNYAENVLIDNVELSTGYLTFTGNGSWDEEERWTNSNKPSSDSKVIINGTVIISNGSDITVNQIYINNGMSLTIESGATLSVTSTLVNYDADALIMNDGAQLFQKNDNVAATFNKDIVNPYGEWGVTDESGWQFVASPIINNAINGFVPSEGEGDYDLYKYDGNQDLQWVNYKSHQSDFEAAFKPGTAYLASYEIKTTASFKGILSNDQSFVFDVSYDADNRMANFYLLGNPFSFDMDWNKFDLNDDVYPAFAIVDPSTNGYVVKSNSTTIPVGAGFFVETIGENPSISYNSGSKSRGEKYEYINVIASGKQGSNNVIIKFDGKEEKGFSKLENFNKRIADVYVKNNGNRYSVLGYDREVQEVELFFDAKEMGNYSISIEPNGKFETVVLVDRMTGVETNLLLEDSYTFTAMANDNPNRFVLKFANGQEPSADSQFAYINNGDIVVYNISGDAQINIFDALGRRVYQGECSDETTRIASVYSAGVYVIQKVDDNGINVQKLIINE
ncbi:MAG: choice-of-anchor J domain-containing protein [Bacteroidales bacterium]|nr:choice-of-anchor J domain-containing protein [Bacteroidales bacterium]